MRFPVWYSRSWRRPRRGTLVCSWVARTGWWWRALATADTSSPAPPPPSSSPETTRAACGNRAANQPGNYSVYIKIAKIDDIMLPLALALWNNRPQATYFEDHKQGGHILWFSNANEIRNIGRHGSIARRWCVRWDRTRSGREWGRWRRHGSVHTQAMVRPLRSNSVRPRMRAMKNQETNEVRALYMMILSCWRVAGMFFACRQTSRATSSSTRGTTRFSITRAGLCTALHTTTVADVFAVLSCTHAFLIWRHQYFRPHFYKFLYNGHIFVFKPPPPIIVITMVTTNNGDKIPWNYIFS